MKMNYAYSIYRGFKNWYDALNGATLSGAIDVVVVKQPNGELKSTPFHVRFGRTSAFFAEEKFVDVLVNGKELDVKMKLASDGVAYFVEECEDDDFSPSRSASPIPSMLPKSTDSCVDLRVLGEFPFAPSFGPLRRSTSLPNLTTPFVISTDSFGTKAGESTETEYRPAQKSKSEIHGDVNQIRKLTVDTNDQSLSIEKNGQKENENQADSLRVLLEDDALSDTEVDLMNTTPNQGSVDVAYWPWGKMPETRVISTTDSSKKRRWMWKDLFVNNGTPPTERPDSETKDESIPLDALMEMKDSGSVGKYTVSKDTSPKTAREIAPSPTSTPKGPSANHDLDSFMGQSTPPRSVQMTPSSVGSVSPMTMASVTPSSTGQMTPPQSASGTPSRNMQPRKGKSQGSVLSMSKDKMEPMEGKGGKLYVRSLRLSSDKLKTLGLLPGLNECEYKITTKFQGTGRCVCNVYLYNWDDQIVVSDVDGTITKSDVLGHIIPAIGGSWDHSGVVDLYKKIANNGYKIVYLSSRAIGQSYTTKKYLSDLVQNSSNLPRGPMLLSPTDLFTAFKREVIDRRPQEFKIAALSDLKSLFPLREPFFAGFGNRHTDVTSYRAVGMPLSRIYIVDKHGAVKSSKLGIRVTSYMSLAEEDCDHVFPPLEKNPDGSTKNSLAETTYSFWKENISDSDVTDDAIVAYATKRNKKM